MTRGDVVAWGALLIGVFVLQATAVVSPVLQADYLLVVVFFFGYRYGRTAGLFMGAFSGLLIDLFAGSLIGPHLLSRGLFGYGAGWFAGMVIGRSRLLILAALPVLVFVDGVAVRMAQDAFSSPGPLDVRRLARSALVVGGIAALIDRLWKHDSSDALPI